MVRYRSYMLVNCRLGVAEARTVMYLSTTLETTVLIAVTIWPLTLMYLSLSDAWAYWCMLSWIIKAVTIVSCHCLCASANKLQYLETIKMILKDDIHPIVLIRKLLLRNLDPGFLRLFLLFPWLFLGAFWFSLVFCRFCYFLVFPCFFALASLFLFKFFIGYSLVFLCCFLEFFCCFS